MDLPPRRAARVVLCVTPVEALDQVAAHVGDLPNLGVAYLAAALEAGGVAAEVLNFGGRAVAPEALAARILEAAPSLVGFTVYDDNSGSTLRVVQALRARYAGPVVLGGYAPTFSAERFLTMWSCIDYVILREGEGPLLRLVEHLEGRRAIEDVPNLAYRRGDAIVFTAAGPLEDVGALPWPRRRWEERDAITPILTGRGCSSRCSICAMVPFYDPHLGPAVRRRDPEDVVAEMEHCVAHGAEVFGLYDDCFPLAGAQDRAWCARFLAALCGRGLRRPLLAQLRVQDVLRAGGTLEALCEAGLAHVSIGIESLLPRQLALFRKRHTVDQAIEALALLRGLPLQVHANVLFWDPWSTVEEAREHAALLAEHGIAGQEGCVGTPIGSYLLIPLAGTAIQRRLAREGLALRDPFAFHRWHWDFVDEDTRAFFRDLYLPFLARVDVPRPPAAWSRSLLCDLRGETARGALLRGLAERTARAEHAYLLAVLDLALETGDPERRAGGLASLDASFGEAFRDAARALAAAAGLG